jgi:hypothetical protein
MTTSLGDLWRRVRRRLLPDGSRGERAYHRARLALLMLSQNRLAKTYPRMRQFLEIDRLSNHAGGGARRDYARWMRTHEPTPAQLAQQTLAAAQFPLRPRISIITPVYNPDPQILSDTLASVKAQSYPDWEWCLADASDLPGPTQILLQAQQTDSRLKVTRLEKNGGISANTTAALALATGEFVLMLDHDDLLAPDALFEVVAALTATRTGTFFITMRIKSRKMGACVRSPGSNPPRFRRSSCFPPIS